MKNSIRNRFSPQVRVHPEDTGAPGLVKASMQDECDINNIVKKYLRTGTVNHMSRYGGRYGDFDPLTFHEAMNIVRQGEEMFDALPAKLRRRFQGSPEAFLEYVQNPENIPEMRELGLAEPERAAAEAVLVRMAEEPSSSSESDPPAERGGKKSKASKGSEEPAQ